MSNQMVSHMMAVQRTKVQQEEEEAMEAEHLLQQRRHRLKSDADKAESDWNDKADDTEDATPFPRVDE